MGIHESGEMYLETILLLSEKSNRVRAVDICDEMGFSKPSVSRALGLLRNSEMIRVDDSGNITLTDSGKNRAENIYRRHNILTELLVRLGVSGETASADACKIEHYISDETFEKICDFVDENK